MDGKEIQLCPLGHNGLAVLHPQNIVGPGEQLRGHPHPLHGLLPGRRERDSPVQFLPEQRRKCRVAQRPGRLHQILPLGRFRAEAQGIAQPVQNPHSAGGKPFRRGQAHRHRQLHHQVRPAGHCRFRPQAFVQDGRGAPLNKIPAHGADNGGFRPEGLAHHGKLLPVAHMKRVIFTDNPDNFQVIASPAKFFLLRG